MMKAPQKTSEKFPKFFYVPPFITLLKDINRGRRAVKATSSVAEKYKKDFKIFLTGPQSRGPATV